MAKVKSAFLEFVRHIVNGDINAVSRCLAASPSFATIASELGVTRQDPSTFFFREIAHYLYAGDTALHMAAAAFRRPIAELLIAHGADCRAKNRRGAESLHYAADANRWDPTAQAEMIECLVSVGADPNALNRDSVAPLHRAVRTRSLPAVRALLDGGANPRAPNKSGSTPLHLAVQTSGRGGSGSQLARQQQASIIKLLLERGARLTDKDGRGKRVDQAATSEWIRTLLIGGSGYFRIERAIALAHLKEHAKAAAEVEAVIGDPKLPAFLVQDAAATFAVCSIAVRDDAKLSEQYAVRAIALLRRAFEKNYRAIADDVRQDKRLDSLRKREDYRKLLNEWESKEKR